MLKVANSVINASQITGVVPAANGGTGIANNAAMTVTGVGNFAFTRTLTGATNVTFPTTGTLAASADVSFTASSTGLTATLTGTAYATKTGNSIILNLPNVNGTSNSDSFSLTGMPTSLRPAVQQIVVARIYDNSVHSIGIAVIKTDGVIDFYTGALGVFAITGGKGSTGTTVCYISN